MTSTDIKVTLNEFPYLEFEYDGQLYKVDFDFGDIADNHGYCADAWYVGEDDFGNEWSIDVVVSSQGVDDYDLESIQKH